MKTFLTTLGFAALAGFLLAAPAQAQDDYHDYTHHHYDGGWNGDDHHWSHDDNNDHHDWNHDDHHDWNDGHGHYDPRWHGHPHIVFRDNDRAIITSYINAHRHYCPPGTHRGKHHRQTCLANHQGQVVFYNPGNYLPAEEGYTELPPDLLRQLAPLPPDFAYERSGDNVYLMNKTDRTITDAINLFSDLSR